MLVRAMVLAAKKLSSDSKTPVEVLEDIVLGRFESEVTNGTTVIQTAEAGGSTSFSIMSDMSPADVLALAMEAIARIKAGEFGDEEELENVYPKRVIKRLRAAFSRATVT